MRDGKSERYQWGFITSSATFAERRIIEMNSKMWKQAIAVIVALCISVVSFLTIPEKAYAAGSNYWLTGNYEYSELIYNGNTLKFKKKWGKTSLKEGPSYSTYSSAWKKMNKEIKISSKCILEMGDDVMEKMPFKTYIKKYKVKKREQITCVSMAIKVVKGKVVKVGFYS